MLERYFSRIYVINLASRSDRRREMAQELARVGLSYDDEMVNLFTAVCPDEAGQFPSIGARGCFLSHLGILKDAAARNDGPIAIFEDDLALATDFAERAPAMLEALAQEDWAIFYGGYENHVFETEGLIAATPETPLRTTHFICFNQPVIGAVIDHLETLLSRQRGDPAGGPMHVDGAYHWFRNAHPELATFAASPPLGYQRSSRSDIAALRWYDRTPVVDRAVALMRKIVRQRR